MFDNFERALPPTYNFISSPYRMQNKELPVEISEKIGCELGNKPKTLSIKPVRNNEAPRFEFQGKDHMLAICPV